MTELLIKNKTYSPTWLLESDEQNSVIHDTSNSENLVEVIDFISEKGNLCFDKPYFSIGNILIKLISLYKKNNLFESDKEPQVKDYCLQDSIDTVIDINQTLENYIKNISIASICTIQLDTFSRRLKSEELKNFGFYLENPNEITSFLTTNPKIRYVLEETKDQVAKYFNEFELHLSLYTDYEEEYEVLNIIIYSGLDTEKLIECENLLFDNWFEKYYSQFNGKLTIRVYPK